MERVQAYTHPLWFLLLSASTFVSGSIYYSSLILSLVFSLGALALVALRGTERRWNAVLAVGVLIAPILVAIE